MEVKDISSFDPESLVSVGFQATNLGKAIKILKNMEGTRFLSFTSNLIASGLRGVIADLLKRKKFDVVITAGGAIDHDIIKSFMPYYLHDGEKDVELHSKGINRLSNIIIPNDRYKFLESYVQERLEKAYKSGKKEFSHSELISYLSEDLADERSFLYWARKNNIPVFSPGLTDSAIGLQLYMFRQRHSDFVLNSISDMSNLANIIFNSSKTSGLIIGGGISKHYTIASNLLRGGLDSAVYITTATPFDGSLSGARAEEAISWGKIKEDARYITVNGDATIILPIISSFL